ncbi:hypothetical protein VP01_269g11 [Puccinia sorghi]|uniref:Uncharacterized protein n=1 Tax=Puccinia sorghi TaxID=27349 RepID=A0A0L6V3Q0_9BASI|nr:hypothetical protein VP01_269g11 [Puccinia sorghi]
MLRLNFQQQDKCDKQQEYLTRKKSDRDDEEGYNQKSNTLLQKVYFLGGQIISPNASAPPVLFYKQPYKFLLEVVWPNTNP